MNGYRYTAEELSELPTLSTGWTDNLKIDTGETRVWLARVGVEDGMPFDNGVTVERLIDGCWEETEYYAGDA